MLSYLQLLHTSKYLVFFLKTPSTDYPQTTNEKFSSHLAISQTSQVSEVDASDNDLTISDRFEQHSLLFLVVLVLWGP